MDNLKSKEIIRFFSKQNIYNNLKNEKIKSDEFILKIKSAYSELESSYRNEFFFKNTLFNKLLMGKYNIATTMALNEISIGKSKADFVIINKGKGIVYEIKTDLDNLERLIYQLNDYLEVFSELYVVTTINNFYPVFKLLKEYNSPAGIIILTDKNTLNVMKKASINHCMLKHETLFKLLRKKEYKSIILEKFGRLPEVKEVEFFKACLIEFKKIEVLEAQKLVFNKLRDRTFYRNSELFKKMPEELRWLMYQSNFSEEELEEMLQAFD